MIIILLILILIVIIWLIFNSRPLSTDETQQLAQKRRRKDITKYYSFSIDTMDVDIEFKKRMQPNGRFYQVAERIDRIPSICAALLKYKKHEWMILAFERKRIVDLLWLNKGVDNTSVACLLPLDSMGIKAARDRYVTVFRFHNHPNSNPSQWDCTKPSKQDYLSAAVITDELSRYGVGFIDFVCERGRHFEFWRSVSDRLFPEQEYIVGINEYNGKSKWMNLILHFELKFGR